ncbi:helix-turn-helix domain-containing protein [Bradyrhizobium sp.]|uniref:helix-turn-helix domain-containing protein n=1 Tax=Bradyrhizobium sp. TaxID=376 RepID=UPI004037AAEF
MQALRLAERRRVGGTIKFDTAAVPARRRISFWEEKCADRVVGLRCTSLEPTGLKAQFQYVELGATKLIDIAGGQHVVERTPELVRKIEKDAVFLILLVRGKAFINRANDCLVLNEGDCVLYDTNRPYMHGFPGEMRHVIFEVRGEDFRQRFPAWDLTKTFCLDASLGAGRHVSATLRKILARHHPFSEVGGLDQIVEAEVWNGLELAYATTRSECTNYQLLMINRIKQFILANLRDPNLSPQLIADEVGLGVRQVHRLFGQEAESLSETIIRLRLQRCKEHLLRRDRLRAPVSEIAYHWGFKSLAHFSRKFHEQFGCTPSKIRS